MKSKNPMFTHKISRHDDIVEIILADHKPLKKLIETLKDTDQDISTRRAAFKEFAPSLISHAKPEERTLYVQMKKDGDQDLTVEALEGDVEHGLADQLVKELKAEHDGDLWTAKAKVLAELVEHHIKEEEDELLPDFRANSTLEERVKLGQEYNHLKATFEKRTRLVIKKPNAQRSAQVAANARKSSATARRGVAARIVR